MRQTPRFASRTQAAGRASLGDVVAATGLFALVGALTASAILIGVILAFDLVWSGGDLVGWLGLILAATLLLGFGVAYLAVEVGERSRAFGGRRRIGWAVVWSVLGVVAVCVLVTPIPGASIPMSAAIAAGMPWMIAPPRSTEEMIGCGGGQSANAAPHEQREVGGRSLGAHPVGLGDPQRRTSGSSSELQ